MYRNIASLLTILWALLLAGCTAITINELDGELMDTYALKVRMNETEGAFPGSDAIPHRFTDLSVRAETAAEKLGDDDVLDKIALLRIAATAAWQAHDHPFSAERRNAEPETSGESEKSDPVLKFATAGKQLCAKLEPTKAPPRDCAYFDVVTTLSNQTRNARELQYYRRRKGELPVDERLEMTRDYLVAAATAFKKATEHRDSLRARGLPESYYRWLDRQRMGAYCDARISRIEYNGVYADMPADEPLSPSCSQNVANLTNPSLFAMETSLEKSYKVDCTNLDQSYTTWKFNPGEVLGDVVVPTIPSGNICKP